MTLGRALACVPPGADSFLHCMKPALTPDFDTAYQIQRDRLIVQPPPSRSMPRRPAFCDKLYLTVSGLGVDNIVRSIAAQLVLCGCCRSNSGGSEFTTTPEHVSSPLLSIKTGVGAASSLGRTASWTGGALHGLDVASDPASVAGAKLMSKTANGASPPHPRVALISEHHQRSHQVGSKPAHALPLLCGTPGDPASLCLAGSPSATTALPPLTGPAERLLLGSPLATSRMSLSIASKSTDASELPSPTSQGSPDPMTRSPPESAPRTPDSKAAEAGRGLLPILNTSAAKVAFKQQTEASTASGISPHLLHCSSYFAARTKIGSPIQAWHCCTSESMW